MGENTDQIERDIRVERAELGRNLEDLELKAKELADWKVHYRNHPAVFLGAAAGIGVLLGAVMAPGSFDRANRRGATVHQGGRFSRGAQGSRN